jgi:hypothetical protein
MAPKKSNSFFTSLVVIGLLAALVFVVRSAVVESREIIVTREAEPVSTAADVVEERVEEAVVEEKELEQRDVVELSLVPEDPNSAFPSMKAEEGDADAALASAFTYDNLQDSMLTSGREAREAIKSRAAWSRFGQRGNPEIWEQQMAEMKREIQASGQTLEQFMETSWAPIPEQMAAFWKDSSSGDHAPEVSTNVKSSQPSRAALSEAPALTRDATQSINSEDKAIAVLRMREILDARKRAKTLKLKLPDLSQEQKDDLERWSASSDKTAAGVARAISSL